MITAAGHDGSCTDVDKYRCVTQHSLVLDHEQQKEKHFVRGALSVGSACQ